MPDLEALARLVADALADLGLPNALCGGFAHNAWADVSGQFPTKDVDLAVLVPEGQAFDTDRVVEALRRRSGQPWFFRDRYRRVDRMLYKFQVGEGDTALYFDLVLPDPHYAKQAIESAAVVQIGGKDGKVLQPEDVILYKALGRRKKDLEKIAKLHELIELDLAYIEAWAKHLGRWDYVQEALAMADDPDRDSEEA